MPPLQNPSAKGAEYEAHRSTGPELSVQGGGKTKNKNNIKTGNATRVSSADRSGETRGRPFRSELPSPIGRAMGRASTRARGFSAYTSRRPDAGVGLCGASDYAPWFATEARDATECPGGAARNAEPKQADRGRGNGRGGRGRPSPTGPPAPTAAATRAAFSAPGPTAGPAEAKRGGLQELRPACPPPRPREAARGPLLRAPPPVRTRRPRAGATNDSGRPRSRDLLRGRVLGIVEIPHLRWRLLRRQRLHEERLEAATLAPSPRQADAGEGTGGEAAAGPIAAAAGAAGVAGWLAGPPARSLALSLAPSLPPSLQQPPARRSHPHTLTPEATRTPPALQPCRPSPLKRHAQGSPPAASRRASTTDPGRGGVQPAGQARPSLRPPGTISPGAECWRRVPELEGSHRCPSLDSVRPGNSPRPSGHPPSSFEALGEPGLRALR